MTLYMPWDNPAFYGIIGDGNGKNQPSSSKYCQTLVIFNIPYDGLAGNGDKCHLENNFNMNDILH